MAIVSCRWLGLAGLAVELLHAFEEGGVVETCLHEAIELWVGLLFGRQKFICIGRGLLSERPVLGFIIAEFKLVLYCQSNC